MAKKSHNLDNQEDIKNQGMTDESTNDVQNEVDNAGEESEEAAEEVQEKSKEQELEEKLAELQDKYLRLSAEYDNYRKRTLREKMEIQENAKEELFLRILPVVDDMERALASVQSAADLKAVQEGMNLIYSKFTGFMNQQGLKEIEAMGKELDTDHHEAITKIQVESKKQKGKIVDVVEKGYMLRDKVIRFAKVVIGE